MFTTKPDTLFGASFIALSVEHDLAKNFTKDREFQIFRDKCLKLQEKKDLVNEKLGFDTKIHVQHPLLTGKKLPVFFFFFSATNKTSEIKYIIIIFRRKLLK